MICLSQCAQKETTSQNNETCQYGGYETQVQWGEHLITVGGCGDCHTPKKMTPMGPVDDSSLLLSGHPAGFPIPEIDRKLSESKGLVTTQTLTFWIGPWGISYSANLTPDSTGLLAWTENQFINCLRNGVSKGITGNRPLLPPMPWPVIKHATDNELKAMFAFLKTIKPIKNIVPQPTPPASAPPPPPKEK
jgi:hypothetical protein